MMGKGEATRKKNPEINIKSKEKKNKTQRQEDYCY